MDLEALASAAAECRACDLWARATQVVFGEGPLDARLMLVGEQPGDQEDQMGHPFVGPAGRVLDAALTEVDLSLDQVYVTNAVKHFKWKPRGKRRLHDKPSRTEMVACRQWLTQELELVSPEVLVALGATAAQSLLGPSFRLTRNLDSVLTDTGLAPSVLATVHPSVVLRAPDAGAREEARLQLVSSLARARSLLAA